MTRICICCGESFRPIENPRDPNVCASCNSFEPVDPVPMPNVKADEPRKSEFSYWNPPGFFYRKHAA